MNPTSANPTAAPAPQPQKYSFNCERHPTEKFTGFCPSCLCERLTTLDQSSSNTPSSSCHPSASSAAAIKSLFSSNSKPHNCPLPPPVVLKPSKPSLFPELRRTKSFSVSRNEALRLSFEPQRRSCDVRARNTLSSLFTLDDGCKTGVTIDDTTTINNNPSISSSSISSTSHQTPPKPVFEETENEAEYVEDSIVVYDDNDEIRPVGDSHFETLRNPVKIEPHSGEVVEDEEVVSGNSLQPMKDHNNLDTREKKRSGGGFWAAASVFSKKWHNWRQKQKMKRPTNGANFTALPVEKPISRQYRETQSEIADYGFGRRSCDTGPRFSLDAVHISFDDPRYSLDEPRASWDGYLIGKSIPRMPPMFSLMEDAPIVHGLRSDMQIPVDDPLANVVNDGVSLPGGSVQTRDYYLDSSSRRRRSLDRSSPMRKSAMGDIDELKLVSNAKVSPTSANCFHGPKVMVGNNNNNSNNNLMDSNSNSQSLRDYCSDTFELGSELRDSSTDLIGIGDTKETKKSRRWSWRWGFSFIHRRNNNGNNNNNNRDEDDEEKYNSRVRGVERSLSESWAENGDFRGRFNRKMIRINSSVSLRNGNHIGGSSGSMRKSSLEVNGKKRRDNDFVLEKSRSARYSPNDVDNGLLRFYLTPMRNSRREALAKIKRNNSHSIARSVLRLS